MQALPVSAVVHFLREVLESNEILSDLWLVGEVSNLSRSQQGHRYFSLKDDQAVLRSVLFRDAMPGAQLAAGDRILAHGRISLYVPRGDLQFICDFVRPEGVGIQAARFEELRARLEREGLFDPGRKRPLPRFPRRIGVVTSPGGAALQDIQNVLARRWPLAELVLSPALVQGDQAHGQVVAALRALAREPIDVAIVARGGGSAEDLWAFNDERVARAIFGFPVPVVTGVGHETDLTIADLVADLRAPTPSAAAERCTPDAGQLRASLGMLERAMASAARDVAASRAAATEALVGRLLRAAPNPAARAAALLGLLQGMDATLDRRQAGNRAGVDQHAARLAALNPYATLARGFAIVKKSGSRKVINSVRKVRPGDRLDVAVGDGAFWVEVS